MSSNLRKRSFSYHSIEAMKQLISKKISKNEARSTEICIYCGKGLVAEEDKRLNSSGQWYHSKCLKKANKSLVFIDFPVLKPTNSEDFNLNSVIIELKRENCGLKTDLFKIKFLLDKYRLFVRTLEEKVKLNYESIGLDVLKKEIDFLNDTYDKKGSDEVTPNEGNSRDIDSNQLNDSSEITPNLLVIKNETQSEDTEEDTRSESSIEPTEQQKDKTDSDICPNIEDKSETRAHFREESSPQIRNIETTGPKSSQMTRLKTKQSGISVSTNIATNGRHVCHYSGCQKSFDSLFSLLKHKTIHPKAIRHICLINGCNCNYPTENGLHRHQKLAHPQQYDTIPWIECKETSCTFRTKELVNYIRHKSTLHIRTHICLVCKIVFPTELRLKSHMSSTHTLHNYESPDTSDSESAQPLDT